MHRRRHVCGMHAVRTLLTVRPASVHEVSVADSRSDRRCASIIDMASAADIPVHILPRHELDQLQPGVRHQGVIASVDLPDEGLREVYRRLIALRKAHARLFAAGDVTWLEVDNPNRVLAYGRHWNGERAIVAFNASEDPQALALSVEGGDWTQVYPADARIPTRIDGDTLRTRLASLSASRCRRSTAPSKSSSLYSRTQVPGPRRPQRPDRCCALACETGSIGRRWMRLRCP